MSRILIRRKHKMKTPALRKRAESLARQLQDEYGGDYHWEGNTGLYRYAGGIDAELRLSTKEIVIEAKLGMLMGVFRRHIEDEINRYLDEHVV